MKKIRILHADDWIGLYIDSSLVYEGRSIDEERMVDFLLPTANFKSVWDEDGDYIVDRCPDHWPDDLG